MLKKYDEIKGLKAKDIMSPHPKTIAHTMLAVKALELMQSEGISQLLAMENDTYMGIVHVHNLINEGIL